MEIYASLEDMITMAEIMNPMASERSVNEISSSKTYALYLSFLLTCAMLIIIVIG